MAFLIFHNADVYFNKEEFTWRFYTTTKALPITWKVKFINNKEFAKIALDKNIKAFVVHVSCLDLKLRMTIHLAKTVQRALLLAEKVSVLAKYLHFANVFLKKLANVFPKQTRAKSHAIKLKQGKQPPYEPIYSLGPVELEIFKTYIKTNLANGFIKALKLQVSALILFVHKLDDSNLSLYVNY